VAAKEEIELKKTFDLSDIALEERALDFRQANSGITLFPFEMGRNSCSNLALVGRRYRGGSYEAMPGCDCAGFAGAGSNAANKRCATATAS